MGARLARFTGNDTYAKIAEATFDWVVKIGFLDTQSYAIYDGAHVKTECTDLNKAQFSYNNAIFTQGCAFMYNYVCKPVTISGGKPPACLQRIN